MGMLTINVNRILYPTDRSASAEHAYGHAIQLAASLGADLHVLHVVVPDLEDLVERVDPGSLLPAVAPAGVNVQTSVRAGESAAGEILDYCNESDIDLVVMGTRGRTGIGRLLLGSVAEKVVREAPCPVLSIPSRAPSDTVTRVLAAIDFSEFSQITLAHAQAFARLYDVPLDVLHVLQEVMVPSAYGPEIGPIVTPVLERRTHEALVEMVRDVIGAGANVQARVSVGYPASEILRQAEETNAGLIVMATHGLTGLQHFMIGSVTEKVVRKASCPVLTVRSFGKSLVDAPAVRAS